MILFGYGGGAVARPKKEEGKKMKRLSITIRGDLLEEIVRLIGQEQNARGEQVSMSQFVRELFEEKVKNVQQRKAKG